MAYTDNFSEETQLKATLLKLVDLFEGDEQINALTDDLINQTVLYLLREKEKYVQQGISEEEIQKEIQKKGKEILHSYTGNVENLTKGIHLLTQLNNIYALKEEMSETISR